MDMHKNIKLITWLNFCLDFRIYSAIAIIYFTQITNSFALALGVFSISTISSSIFELPTGVFSDFLGRKITVIFGQLSSLFAIIFYAIAGSFVFLAIGAILEGLAYAFFSGNNSALLYDSLKEEGKEEHYGEYEGKTSSMFQIALGISALIGSIALGFKSFQFLFWLSVIPQTIGLFLSFYLIEPKRHYKNINTNIFFHLRDSLNRFKENYKLRTLSLARILDYGIGESIHQFYPAFIAMLWPAWAISFARFLNHIFAATGFRMAGKIIKKIGEFNTLIWGSATNFFISTIIIAIPTIFTPLINSFTSFIFGVSSVAKSSLLQKEFSNQQRATMGSLNSLAGSLFFGIVAFLLGLWADKVGVIYALLTAQLLLVFSLLIYWNLFQKNKKQKI